MLCDKGRQGKAGRKSTQHMEGGRARKASLSRHLKGVLPGKESPVSILRRQKGEIDKWRGWKGRVKTYSFRDT